MFGRIGTTELLLILLIAVVIFGPAKLPKLGEVVTAEEYRTLMDDHTITRDTAAGRGFTAIMVSWLAKFNPLFMVLTSFLLVFMQKGAGEISTAFNLNDSFSEILTGIIIFFIIGCEFFIQYSVKLSHSRKEVASK